MAFVTWSADMAARLREVRCHFPVAVFVLFTWNVEFLQTFAFVFVSHKAECLFYGNKHNGSCKHAIELKIQLREVEKRRFESFEVFSGL